MGGVGLIIKGAVLMHENPKLIKSNGKDKCLETAKLVNKNCILFLLTNWY